MHVFNQRADLQSITNCLCILKSALIPDQSVKRMPFQIFLDQIKMLLIFFQVVNQGNPRMTQFLQNKRFPSECLIIYLRLGYALDCPVLFQPYMDCQPYGSGSPGTSLSKQPVLSK